VGHSQLMRVKAACGTAGFVAAIMVAGCGAGAGEERGFTLADAARIVDVRPAAPGWTWPRTRAKSVSSDSAPPTSTDPVMVEFEKQTRDLVDLGYAVSHWQDNDKLAHLDIAVYRNSSDAHRTLAPFNTFSRGFAKRFGLAAREERIDRLGDEAWLLQAAGSTGPEVTYHWRRDNLVVETHVQCFGSCPAGIAAAVRAWADAVDARARALS
jgi:hypothetical protein